MCLPVDDGELWFPNRLSADDDFVELTHTVIPREPLVLPVLPQHKTQVTTAFTSGSNIDHCVHIRGAKSCGCDHIGGKRDLWGF